MLLRNGELWMLKKPDKEVEHDYLRLFRVGLKSLNSSLMLLRDGHALGKLRANRIASEAYPVFYKRGDNQKKIGVYQSLQKNRNNFLKKRIVLTFEVFETSKVFIRARSWKDLRGSGNPKAITFEVF